MNILGIAGSLRRQSYNRSALRAAQQLAPAGVTINILELDGIPGFNEDDEKNPPGKVVELKKQIRAPDALLIVTPEYNYSIPGVLKTAIDWASRPYGDSAWSGKPAAIMGVSVGNTSTARAQYHLRPIFVFLNIFPINQPEVMIGNVAQRLDAQGNLTDETPNNTFASCSRVLWSGPQNLRSNKMKSGVAGKSMNRSHPQPVRRTDRLSNSRLR